MRGKSLFGLVVLFAVLVLWPCSVTKIYASEEGHAVQQEAVVNHHVAASGEGSGAAMHEGAHHAEGGAHGEHHGLTHQQIMNFIWHTLNFALLVVILVKFLKAPIANALKSRTEDIEKAFAELEEKKKEAERKYAEYEKKLSTMDKEAERILSSFIQQGEAEKQKIIEQARQSAERIKAQAELYVQQELQKARHELQREVAEIAVKMAEDIIRKNLNEQDHHRLISEYLEKVVTKN
ncbi:ATP synthase F0 sector subunit b [Dissulfuribacter thermophilus]|uniref:ATP synthase subunit b n=1 Tax=Dissulfuribacter thermophilus TaxID=1156395 RepID=A0A1B9F754_9BACT|nr:F0F1 ATP synthase subunit B [Dissulfuribacter thermophilus]OCC15788.1 ATP synthase F0 sector subunit b [Dissulfuribacter thermophilus]